MNTIIEKIRAEVDKLPEKYKGLYKQFGCSLGFIDGLDEVKKILSDLEKEEEPTNIDFEQELYKHFGQVKDFTLGMQIGKYFYELGKQEKPKKGLHSGSLRKVDNPMKWMEDDAKEPTTAEGLEEEINEQWGSYTHDGTSAGISREEFMDIARHFAQWGAEHLKR